MFRDCLRRIFQPLITDIQRLVDEQINLVLIKRMLEGHKDASNIKVSHDYETTLEKSSRSKPTFRRFSWSADLAQVSI